jgi:GTP-binding protein
MLGWLERYNIPPIIVLTKCDKLSKTERARQTVLIASAVKRDKSMLLPFSALSKDGRDGIWQEIKLKLGISMGAA